MKENELDYLLSQDEGEELDFKLQLSLISESQKHELAKDVSAMANTNGGYIIIGVEDKTHKPVGVPPRSINFDKIQQIVSSRIDPPVRFYHHIFKRSKGDQLIVFEIPNSPMKPHQDRKNGIFWKRRGPITGPAHRLEILEMEREAKSIQRITPSKRGKIPRRTREIRQEYEYYQDNRVFIFGEKPVSYRKIYKTGSLSHVAHCPVFLPEFDVVPPPEFGHKSTAYVTSGLLGRKKPGNFSGFIKNVEKTWQLLTHKILRETHGPFYWTLSNNEFMIYGCGAQNLIYAMEKYDYGTIGAVLQGAFGEHYFRTCFLVIGAYWKGGFVRNVEMSLYLSCIPTNWSWINRLYDSFKYFKESGAIPNSFTTVDLHLLNWVPNRVGLIAPKILGGLRRIGFGEERESDRFSGVIIGSRDLKNIGFKLNSNSWHGDSSLDTTCSLQYLEEAVVSLTNPPPFCDEIESGKIKMIDYPKVTTVIFPAPGFRIYGINVHSVPVFEHDIEAMKSLGKL